ncbi:MAG TPA: sigma-70 family RNA polymerase sigma factor [Chloroflexota bacterium]|nr:sigma-70 family RNA polymerase sigma factor [Chloroflexota bacterium]HZU06642.1 sigma-70 family RNA polymerase sigma factor [Chloroflexota bacterium]
MERHAPLSCRAVLTAAQARGWITLEELLQCAATSPVQPEELTSLAHEAGIELVEGEAGEEEAWEKVGMLAEKGPSALVTVPPAPPEEEELAPGSPAALYLQEISKTPLLTAEEEITLAQQLEAGEAAKRQLAKGVADAATRARLEAAVQAGEAARRRLIEANLRLVVAVARRYLGRGLSFLDLVQEGNIGLQRAVDKYDWRRGFRFSTYAYWWIRQAISRAVAAQARTIRLPVHVIEQLTRVYDTMQALHQELGREPTVAEIAARLGVEPERVREAFQAARVPISLDTPLTEEEEATVADFIADLTARSPAEVAEEQVLTHTLDEALRRYLTPREARVLQLRFGLAGEAPRTLTEIAAEVGVSRERVRQIEAEALAKLRQAAAFREQFQAYTG